MRKYKIVVTLNGYTKEFISTSRDTKKHCRTCGAAECVAIYKGKIISAAKRDDENPNRYYNCEVII